MDDLVFLLVSQIFWNVIFQVEWHSFVNWVISDKHYLSEKKKKKEEGHFD